MATSSPATTGGLLAPHVLQDTWAKARAQDGIPDLHLHDPGHLAGTLAPSTGVGTRELMYLLGHTSHQGALRFGHATKQCDERSLTVLTT